MAQDKRYRFKTEPCIEYEWKSILYGAFCCHAYEKMIQWIIFEFLEFFGGNTRTPPVADRTGNT